jgi:RNA polymerase sigma factor (sigma-70 family)
MDTFVENLEKIRAIAKKINEIHSNYYNEDELINEAFIGYNRSITNNSELKDKFKTNIRMFLSRVKWDIKDYIRNKSKLKNKQRRENKGQFYPLSVNFSALNTTEEEGQVKKSFNPSCIDDNFKKIDNIDLLDCLNSKVKLTNREWRIIQTYFYGEKTLKEIGKKEGISDNRVCTCKTEIIKKYLSVSENLK